MSAPNRSPFIEYRLRLVGDKVPEGQKAPTLQVRVDERTKNEVQLICNTGVNGADGKPVSINAKLDALTFTAVCGLVDEIHTKEPGFKNKPINCYGPRKKQPGQQGPARGLDAVIQIGKDQNGACYIAVLRQNTPAIKFVFRPGQWNEMVDPETRQPADISTISNIYSRAWSRLMSQLIVVVLANPANVYDYREDQDNNGGGNNYQRNNNGGQYQQRQQQQQQAPVASDNGWENDIPM